MHVSFHPVPQESDRTVLAGIQKSVSIDDTLHSRLVCMGIIFRKNW
jgi:hypothetical protein